MSSWKAVSSFYAHEKSFDYLFAFFQFLLFSLFFLASTEAIRSSRQHSINDNNRLNLPSKRAIESHIYLTLDSMIQMQTQSSIFIRFGRQVFWASLSKRWNVTMDLSLTWKHLKHLSPSMAFFLPTGKKIFCYFYFYFASCAAIVRLESTLLHCIKTDLLDNWIIHQFSSLFSLFFSLDYSVSHSQPTVVGWTFLFVWILLFEVTESNEKRKSFFLKIYSIFVALRLKTLAPSLADKLKSVIPKKMFISFHICLFWLMPWQFNDFRSINNFFGQF